MHAFEAYCSSDRAKTVKSVKEEYERLSALTDDAITWRIIPSVAEPFTVFLNARDTRLIVLPGFMASMEYHPIRVMCQFGFQQCTFVDSTAPELLQAYPLSTTAPTKKLADLMQHGVRSTDIAAVRGVGCTHEYVTEVQELRSINEIPPGGPLFPDSRQSKKA